jgi:hypothetical protein
MTNQQLAEGITLIFLTAVMVSGVGLYTLVQWIRRTWK